jgi:hypothetical protein
MRSSITFSSAYRAGYLDYRKLSGLESEHAEQSKSTKKPCLLWTMVRIQEANGVTYPMFHKS